MLVSENMTVKACHLSTYGIYCILVICFAYANLDESAESWEGILLGRKEILAKSMGQA